MARVYLSLGSNIEPLTNLRSAVDILRKEFGNVTLSPVYRTAAVGFDGPDFLNAAAAIDTTMPPDTLNTWLHAVEDRAGRRRDVPRFSSRPLDIDIVLYDDLVMRGAGHLELPRGELATQAFVLKPMTDIAPDTVHPTLGKSLRNLWETFPDSSGLMRIDQPL